MSDGPFKNLKLVKHWKRFAEAVQNDTYDRDDCCSLASHALMHEVLIDDVKLLLMDLQSNVSREQLDLVPNMSLEFIFNSHMNGPFADTLQKEIALCLNEQVTPSEAFRQGLEATVKEQINEAISRIEEECIRSRELGDMWQDQFNKTVKQANAIFRALDINKICEALLAGDKNAFKKAVSKKMGLDEGPSL